MLISFEAYSAGTKRIRFSSKASSNSNLATSGDSAPISAGFGGDVWRASKLYRELTEGYVSFLTVEELIKAGKD